MASRTPLDVASLSHPGMVRPHNEDTVFVDGEAGLAVLPFSIWHANSRARRTRRGLVMGFANIADADEAGRLARTLRACLDG